jgi:hypothetical protein
MRHSDPPPTAPSQPDGPAIADAILALLASRAPSASICPSDVARALFSAEPAWRAAMPAIRAVAAELAAEGRVRITRGSLEVDAQSKGGPIRIRRP